MEHSGFCWLGFMYILNKIGLFSFVVHRWYNEVSDVPQFLTGGFLMPCTGWSLYLHPRWNADWYILPLAKFEQWRYKIINLFCEVNICFLYFLKEYSMIFGCFCWRQLSAPYLGWFSYGFMGRRKVLSVNGKNGTTASGMDFGGEWTGMPTFF